MRILIASSEAVPFCKTGGLADVVGTLASKLAEAGHEVSLFLPRYKAIAAKHLRGARSVELPALGVRLRRKKWGSVSVVFVDHTPSFERDGLYGLEGRDHPDNDRRFSLFARAVLEGAKALDLRPDVVHGHDWQTGLVFAYLRGDPRFARTASVFTIHNMAYQGNFPRESLSAAGLSGADFTPDGVEYYGQVSFLKAGLAFAGRLTTVSPTYAREIQEPGGRGFGMEGLLARRAADLHGILNGIDLETWDPASDPALAARYSAADPGGKAACRRALLAECGLPADSEAPVLGVVSRLDRQKGLDLALEVLPERLGRCRLVVLGDGDPALRDSFTSWARRRPHDVYFRPAFDDPFAHRLYAGADAFLMPSRFEPCGLGQMIAMRYGTVPIASRTGGLADTVFEDGPRANGYRAEPGDAPSLAAALDRALGACGTEGWAARRRAGMEADFSWDRSVGDYLEVYRRAGAS